MGRRLAEVPEEIQLVPYDVVAGKDGMAAVRVRDKTFTPPEISAMILQKLKAAAEAYLGSQGHRGGDHGSGLLQRRAAPGDQGRRRDRRPRRQAHHQRADRGGARLRARQEEGREDRRLRLRRRHLRHLDPRGGRERRRGEGDQRRHAPGRRQPRPAPDRLPDRRVQEGPGHRPLEGLDGVAAPARGRREGEDRALERGHHRHQPALHHGGQDRPEAHDAEADPREVRAAGRGPDRPHARAVPGRAQGLGLRRRRASTRCCWSAARPASRWSSRR